MDLAARREFIPTAVFVAFSALVGAAVTASSAPLLIAGLLAVWVSLARATSGQAVWQKLTVVALLGYIVLNYGFANLAFTFGGIPVPVGHVLALSALALALPGKGAEVRLFLRERLVRAWLALLGLSLLHLLSDIPAHGLYGIRDASFIIEGLFLLSGFLWAVGERRPLTILKPAALLFVVNFLYALTYPLGRSLQAASPISGIFQQVPLLGTYAHTPLFLISGALLLLLAARSALLWPSWLAVGLALAQVAWSFVFQARYVYIGTLAVILALLPFLSVRRAIRASATLLAGGGLLVFGISTVGVDLAGRIGPIEPSFYWAHLRSLLLEQDAPGTGTLIWRLSLIPELLEGWSASLGTIVFGVGFGEPLTDMVVAGGIVVRQPHNTHLTVLIRTGLVGVALWVAMHVRAFRLFRQALRSLPESSPLRDVLLWFFSYYLLGLIATTAQPWLEFSYGAIPFYLLLGYGVGLARRVRAFADRAEDSPHP